MRILAFVFVLAAATPTFAQETKPIPKDSVEIVTMGCLKGRVFTATGQPEGEGVRQGPDVIGRHFRAAGPRQVMDLVKKHDGHLVEVVGVVRKSALSDEGIGMRVGGARVVIGQPTGDRSRMNAPTAPSIPVMDLTVLRYVSDKCPIR